MLVPFKECVFSWNFGVQSWCIVVVQLCRLCRIVGVFGSGWRGIFLVVLLWGLFGGLRWCRRLLTFLVLLCGLWRGTGSANLLGLLCGKNSGSSLVFGLLRGVFFCPRVPTRCPSFLPPALAETIAAALFIPSIPSSFTHFVGHFAAISRVFHVNVRVFTPYPSTTPTLPTPYRYYIHSP